MANHLLIVHAPDAGEEVIRLTSLLSITPFTSVTLPDILPHGPIDINQLVTDCLAVITVLTPGLDMDTLCLATAKYATNQGKSISVCFTDIQIPSWSSKPFNLGDDFMFDINWNFFLTQLRATQHISELGSI